MGFILIGEKINPQTEAVTYAAVASYNNNWGLEITGSNAVENKVYGSFFGTNTAGAGTGNTSGGVEIDNKASENVIGGVQNANEMNVISGNTGAFGVYIADASNNIIAGNRIGTSKAGFVALPNKIGVDITGQSSRNSIGVRIPPVGGVQPNPANLISGNTDTGVGIIGQQATTNFIVGNWIGVDATGNAALPNATGVQLINTQGNYIGRTVGDTSKANLNVISGNTGTGILVSGAPGTPSTNNVIQNNNIGIGPSRQKPVAVPNNVGISFDANSMNNTVRGTVVDKNKNDAIPNAANNKIFDPNSISDNGFGIDDGTQAGAPVLTSAVVSGNTLIVTGTLSNTPNANFGLEFFGGNDLDPDGSAEGAQWLGTAYVNTDANGNASFQVTLNSIYGTYITATATNMAADGNTSDFSNNLTISGESQNAAVGGNVWDDANANGLPDSGETGVSAVNVQLFTALGTLVASTTSDANGNYLFTSVAPGDYYLQFTAPSGFTFTTPYQGDDTVASHADPTTGQTEQFSLIAGEDDPYYNAGLIPTSLEEATTTTIDTTENPSTYGYQVTFTATVAQTDAVPLGGNVTFMDGDTVLGTVDLTSDSGGYQAQYTTSALSVGAHTITAVYNGDGFHLSSNAALTQTVQQGLSFTTVSSSNNPALAGQPVTLTANVASAEGTPTGTVTFVDGTTTLGTAPLDANGNAALTTSSLALGSHNITATYGGDSNFTGSSGSLTQVVSQENTSNLSLASSVPSNATLNQSITFTATVNGSSGTPTGSVTFLDGDTVLSTSNLDGTGKATFTTSTLSLGSHDITAIYSGDGTYGSNSAALTQTVTQGGAFTSLTVSVNPVQPGQPVTFTATVHPEGSSGTPTGSVTFLDGTTILGTAPLTQVSGQLQAAFTTSSLSSGSHAITAIYSGDNTFQGSSVSVTEIVGQSSGAGSSVALSSSVIPALLGQSVTLTATVTGSGTPTGSVTFFDGSTALATVPLSVVNGQSQASWTTSTLGLGVNDIIAVYSGDSNNAASANTFFLSVNQGGTSTSLTSSANPSPAGQDVTFTATVLGMGMGVATPTGTVSFYDGTTFLGTGRLTLVNGQMQATFTTAALGLGSHRIIAVYTGDSTFADSGAALQQTISS
ncbi:MAG TPA: Ig-like domain repeat protein [Gemmataceae bacterium]